MIKVEIPEADRGDYLGRDDIFGSVEGTDTYTTDLKTHPNARFKQLRNGYVLEFPIPGAKRKMVKDTIVVGSEYIRDRGQGGFKKSFTIVF